MEKTETLWHDPMVRKLQINSKDEGTQEASARALRQPVEYYESDRRDILLLSGSILILLRYLQKAAMAQVGQFFYRYQQLHYYAFEIRWTHAI